MISLLYIDIAMFILIWKWTSNLIGQWSTMRDIVKVIKGEVDGKMIGEKTNQIY